MASLDGVAPIRMVSVFASVNLSLHHKVQKFSSGTISPGWSQKRAVKRLWCGCGGGVIHKNISVIDQIQILLIGSSVWLSDSAMIYIMISWCCLRICGFCQKVE